MKRYTLIFSPLDRSVTTENVREELDQVMLYLHPRITYKIGQVTIGMNGQILANVAMEGKRELLEATLKDKRWLVPVRYETMGWGWLMDNEDASLLTESILPIEKDPLLGIKPADGSHEFMLSRRKLWLRYIALVISTIILILLLIANAIRTNLPWLEWVYIVSFLFWLFALNDTPFDFRAYASKILCGQTGLEVATPLRKKPVLLEWNKIFALEYKYPVCLVCSPRGKLRFLLSERFGCQEKSVILKTIITRAKLNYVQGNIMSTMYRRFDA